MRRVRNLIEVVDEDEGLVYVWGERHFEVVLGMEPGYELLLFRQRKHHTYFVLFAISITTTTVCRWGLSLLLVADIPFLFDPAPICRRCKPAAGVKQD